MICRREDCTGCFACYNICPQNCITMIEDEFGYIYPSVNKDSCINCGLCKKVCFNYNNLIVQEPKEAFALWNKDKIIREQSTSGGAATTLSKYVLKNNGVVYGAAYIKKGIVEHIRVDNEIDLQKLQGSKYVHSYINDAYKNVRSDLNFNRLVIFFGTPCQIAGLKLFLQKEYTNLYLVDLICHGVPSQKFLKDEIMYLVGDLSVNRISFRNSEGYILELYKSNELIKKIPMNESMYYKAFMRSISYRENCYRCKFAQAKRCSDLTIGDFWGIGKEDKCNYLEDSNLGISVALPITPKGEFLLKEIKKYIFIDRRKLTEAINGNTQLRETSKKRINVIIFRKYYRKVGFQKAVRKAIFFDSLKQNIKQIIKNNRLLYRIVKRVKK